MNVFLLVGSISAFSQPYSGEKLSRGLIGIPTEDGMYFSWRMTLEDAAGLQFDLYRSSNGGAEVKLNKEPIDRTSDFLDRTVDYTVDNRWTLKATTGEVATWTRLKGEERNPYLSIPVCKPEDGEIKLTVPTGLIPYCPRCGKPMSMNLRSDQTFVEDDGWHQAAERYEKFIQDHKKQKIVFLELGVGYNTPGIIKYPFWQMTNTFQHAFYVCLNQSEAYAPEEIRRKSVCMNEDIGEVLKGYLMMDVKEFDQP